MNRNKGILFWITGFSGSGKTTIAKKILKTIISNYGPTILVNGDDLRHIFKLKGYTLNDRKKISKFYCNYAKFITNQKINLIFTVVSMIDEPRIWNRNNISNYIEIYIKSNLNKILKNKKKKIYLNKKNIVGIDVSYELPKKPDIILVNNFKKNINELSKELLSKIQKKILNK